jgi:hypothetical protein
MERRACAAFVRYVEGEPEAQWILLWERINSRGADLYPAGR